MVDQHNRAFVGIGTSKLRNGDRPRAVGLHLGDQSRGRGISCNGEPVDRGHGPLELWRARPAHNPSALTRSNSLITAKHHRTSIVQKRGQDHGKGNSRAYYVADHMIDARSAGRPIATTKSGKKCHVRKELLDYDPRQRRLVMKHLKARSAPGPSVERVTSGHLIDPCGAYRSSGRAHKRRA